MCTKEVSASKDVCLGSKMAVHKSGHSDRVTVQTLCSNSQKAFLVLIGYRVDCMHAVLRYGLPTTQVVRLIFLYSNVTTAQALVKPDGHHQGQAASDLCV